MLISLLKRKFVRHFLAMLGSAGFLAAVPVLLYVGMMVWYDDPGGPLNIVIVPLGSAILGIVISVTAFLPLGLLREHYRVRYWILGAVLLAAYLLLVLLWLIGAQAFDVPAKAPSPPLFIFLGVFYLYLLVGLLIHFLWLAGLQWWVNRSRPTETPA